CAEPDWKSVLKQLVDALEPCGNILPVPAKHVLLATQGLLDARPSTERSSSEEQTPAAKKQTPVGEHRKDESTRSAVQAEVLTKNVMKVQPPANGAARPPVRAKVTKCPP